MIDEYQDTNRSQYELMRLLTEAARQRLRGGRRRSVDLRLARRRYPQHSGFRARLSRTRRSFAWSRITARPRTFSKPPARWWRTTRSARARWLWTEAGAGDKIGLYAGYDAENEALFIADTIEKLLAPNPERSRGGSVSHQLAVAPDRRSAAALRPQVHRGGRLQFLSARRSQGHRRVSEAGGVAPRIRSACCASSIRRRAASAARRSSRSSSTRARHGLSLWDAIERMLDEQQFCRRAPQSALAAFRNMIQETVAGGESRRRCPMLLRVHSGAHRLPARCWSRRRRRNREARLENLDELMNAAAEAAERGETHRAIFWITRRWSPMPMPWTSARRSRC